MRCHEASAKDAPFGFQPGSRGGVGDRAATWTLVRMLGLLAPVPGNQRLKQTGRMLQFVNSCTCAAARDFGVHASRKCLHTSKRLEQTASCPTFQYGRMFTLVRGSPIVTVDIATFRHITSCRRRQSVKNTWKTPMLPRNQLM